MDENAEIEYSITEGDGYDMFGITTDKDTQEGIITVKKVHKTLNPSLWNTTQYFI